MKRDQLPPTALAAWARLSNVVLNGVRIEHFSDVQGYAVVAERQTDTTTNVPLIVVPKDLILTKEAVEDEAKSNAHLKQLLDAASGLARTARGTILLFLLLQVSATSPDNDYQERILLSGPFQEYVKFLGPVPLPTCWSNTEQSLLDGTSLEAALHAKNTRLEDEYNALHDATLSIEWCSQVWWQGQFTLDDWALFDSWYRSRALSFATAGEAVVPCIDMCNHRQGESQSAYFDRDDDGNAVLLLPEGKVFNPGDEITISYGDNKSAAEMLFSYGFIDPAMLETSGLSLSLAIPFDDPLRIPKETLSTVAAAVRITRDVKEGEHFWESQFVWLACVNEEDGLEFRVQRSLDGAQEPRVFWKDQDFTDDTGALKAFLVKESLWDVFRLRAVAIIKERVEEQIHLVETWPEKSAAGRECIGSWAWDCSKRLREMETRLLHDVHGKLMHELVTLSETETVEAYFRTLRDGGDFA